ncbi:MAG: tRNA (adenosine(37)-N6)-dimethylallyltransferase MiaA [Lachnospiraceae bacterium]|jgi:tRNA dimethylallyltransferase
MTETKPPLVIIGGATGVGKSELAVSLAREVGGEIISADSMQVYKGFDIGTAKIAREQMQEIPHHLIDILNADGEFNIYEFQRRAKEATQEIYRRGNIPIVVGGTGFYIHALLYDTVFENETEDKSFRKEMEELVKRKGSEHLHSLLIEADPQAAASIHPNNVKRVIRALEFRHNSGIRISRHNTQQKERPSPFNYAYFVLNRQRMTVYSRIDSRVDKMFQSGLVGEVAGLLENGVGTESRAMQGLGYKEILPLLNGEITLEEAAYRIKLGTRHFAKRQLTWFRREKDVIWMNYEDYENTRDMLAHMINILKEKNIV